jgi:hypothetical protein
MKLTYSITFLVKSIPSTAWLSYFKSANPQVVSLSSIPSQSPVSLEKDDNGLVLLIFLYPIIDLNIISTLPHRFTKSTATMHLLMSLALTNSERSCMGGVVWLGVVSWLEWSWPRRKNMPWPQYDPTTFHYIPISRWKPWNKHAIHSLLISKSISSL